VFFWKILKFKDHFLSPSFQKKFQFICLCAKGQNLTYGHESLKFHHEILKFQISGVSLLTQQLSKLTLIWHFVTIWKFLVKEIVILSLSIFAESWRGWTNIIGNKIECENVWIFSILFSINLNHWFNLTVFSSWSTGEGLNWSLTLESTNFYINTT